MVGIWLALWSQGTYGASDDVVNRDQLAGPEIELIVLRKPIFSVFKSRLINKKLRCFNGENGPRSCGYKRVIIGLFFVTSDDVVNHVQLAGPEIAEEAKPDIFGI
jgi:hypothetical protein